MHEQKPATTDDNKLIKLIKENTKVLMGLAIGILIMTAGIAVASNSSKSSPMLQENKQETNQSESKKINDKTEAIKPVETQPAPAPKANTSSSQTPVAAALQPNNVTVPAAPTCNISLKESYAKSYNSQVAYENIVHANWRYSGDASTMQSSYYAREKGVELARHEAKLAQLLVDYQQKLSTINCS
jgi:hypothetical protein